MSSQPKTRPEVIKALKGMPNIGEALRVLRISRAWALSDVSERTGMAISSLKHVEKGISHPEWVTLALLRSLYGIKMSQLMLVAERLSGKRTLRNRKGKGTAK